jgi:hypothetical protein
MRNCPITIILSCVIFIVSGCGKLWNREKDCNNFSLSDEHYWFPFPVGSQTVFKNASGDSILFSKGDNYIWHTSGYTTDTGCGCNDRSGQLHTAGNDSIWFNTEMSYIEDNIPQRIETIGLVWQGRKAVFTEQARSASDSLHIGNIIINDIRKYELPQTSDSLEPRTIYTGRDAGLLRVVLQNGNTWQIYNPISGTVAVNDFTYGEGWCD